MKGSKIYDDIFNAVKQLEPGNPLAEAKDRKGILVRHQRAEWIQLQDGTVAALALSPGMMYYRGECRQFPKTYPNIYRKSKEDQVIWGVKRCDFELFLLEVPEIKDRIKYNGKVDLLALAQHYGFPTNMLDITNDIVIAAYFATHDRNPVTGRMEPVREGIGRLFWMPALLTDDGRPNIRIFGDQSFRRPLSQCGYGLEMAEGEDLQETCGYIEFRQSGEMGELMDRCFDGEDLVYPPEQITLIGKAIQEAEAVTSFGISRYSEECGMMEDEVRETVRAAGLYIVDAPLFHPMTLPEIPNAQPMAAFGGAMRPAMIIG